MTALKEARYVKDYVLWLRFDDGLEGELDLADELSGEIFQPLKTLEYFKKFNFDSELLTVTWPNGADFAPEFLYERLHRKVKRAA